MSSTNADTATQIGDISGIMNKGVSLVTRSMRRYEGILIYIEPVEKKIILQNVRDFGTEGRNQEVGDAEVPAQPEGEIHKFVEFTIDMIHQLKIVDQSDPAIVSYPTSPPKNSEVAQKAGVSLPSKAPF
jgi:protein LSM14